MTAYLIVSSFLISILTLYFSIAVFLKGYRGDGGRNLAFCLFNLSIFAWAFCYMFWQFSDSESGALFWVKGLVFGSILIPYTYFHFCVLLTNRHDLKVIAYIGYALALVLMGLNFGPFIVSGVEERMGFEYWPVTGPIGLLYIAGYAVMSVFGVYLLFSTYNKSTVEIRNKLRYILLGTGVGFAGGGTNFFLWFDIPIAPFGHACVILYILGLGYAMLKYRVLDFSEMAFRILGILGYAALFGALLSVGLILILELSDHTYGSGSFLFWWVLMSLYCVLLLLVSPLVTRFVNEVVQTRLISSRLAYRLELKRLSEEVVTDSAQEYVFETVVTRIAEVMRLDYAAIYTREDLATTFARVADAGARKEKVIGESEMQVDPVVRLFTGKREPVFLDQVLVQAPSKTEEMVYFTGSDSPFHLSDVLFPIAVHDSLFGFLALGASSRAGAFSGIDILLLENLCGELAVSMKAREMERRSSQMEKLLSLGTMAAGLSHELRNPLVSVKTLTSLMEKKPEQFQLNREFAETVQRDVKRIFGIVDGVAAFAQNTKRPLAPVAVADVINEAYFGLKPRFEAEQFTYRAELPIELPLVLADSEQLIQVFQNIMENAVNSLAEWDERTEPGRVEVKASVRGGDRVEQRQWVQLDILDNGPGIAKEFQQRIFDPFVTSRDTGTRFGAAGTGLGLAIVSKIIERHSGRIQVESELGNGTQFRISLPCV